MAAGSTKNKKLIFLVDLALSFGGSRSPTGRHKFQRALVIWLGQFVGQVAASFLTPKIFSDPPHSRESLIDKGGNPISSSTTGRMTPGPPFRHGYRCVPSVAIVPWYCAGAPRPAGGLTTGKGQGCEGGLPWGGRAQ